MINHVVLFKLKNYPEEEKSEIISELKEKLESLKDKIPEAQFIQVNKNIELNSKNYDIVLISHFENSSDLNVYSMHPEHLKVIKRIKETVIERAAIDYIF